MIEAQRTKRNEFDDAFYEANTVSDIHICLVYVRELEHMSLYHRIRVNSEV
jgi:hypothetical protein